MRERFLAVLLALAVSACALPPAGGGYYRPDLTDTHVARITRGLDAAAVRAILGEPWQKVDFPNLRETAWDYLYLDTWGYWVEYSVMMGRDGRVASVVSKRRELPDPD